MLSQMKTPSINTFFMKKALGIFYTNGLCAELLAQLTIRDANARAIDLACGDGILLAAAYHAKTDLLRTNGCRLTRVTRSTLMQHLVGIDILSSAARFAAVRLLFEVSPRNSKPPRIGICNSVKLSPGRILPALNLRSTRNNERRISSISLEPVDVILMNPPFTRQERISPSLKTLLRRRFETYSQYSTNRLGLYAYFTFLADMFLKEGGRIGLVLPATVLRVKSAEGLRKFLLNNYHIEFIVTSNDRPSFSESSKFREIMLIATKRKCEDQNSNDTSSRNLCSLVTLKKLPRNFREVKHLVSEIRFTACTSSGVYKSEYMSVRKIPQKELQNEARNLFCLISASDSKAVNLWTNIGLVGSRKLVTLEQYLNRTRGQISRGLETLSDRGLPLQRSFILANKIRATGLRDRWCIMNKSRRSIYCTDRRSGIVIRVPKRAVTLGLRRFAGTSTVDVSRSLDYVVIRCFQSQTKFFAMRKREITSRIGSWRRHVQNRLGNLAIVRRVGICRPGTKLVAYYSSARMAPSGTLWSIKGVPSEDAKVLSVWFNTTINILQLFLNRVETCGSWMEFHEYVLRKTFVLNPYALSESQKKMLLRVFDNTRREKFPSLLEQLKSNFRARKEMDYAVLRIFGFNPLTARKLSASFRRALLDELMNLLRVEGL